MKLKNYLFAFVLLSFSISAKSQQIEYCGQEKMLKEMEIKSPGYQQELNRIYNNAINYANQVELRRKDVNDTVYTIPVVFHVIYRLNAENLPDSLLINQIEVLNQDFRRFNNDTSKTRSIFKSRAADTKIQFVLASKDPNGNATNGIERKYTTITEFGSKTWNSMKKESSGGSDAWDPEEYMNIWVCNMNYFNQPNILGFATPPYGAANWSPGSSASEPGYDGVVLDYRITGRNNFLALNSTNAAIRASSQGRTATHEVGHYLGLRHIWGDAPSTGPACAVDDGLDDTPLQGSRSNFDCGLGRNTCTQSNDLPDMIENYMDYSSDGCKNMLTKKQASIMRYNLITLRSTLGSREITTKWVPDPIEEFKVYPNPSADGVVTLMAPFSYKGDFSVSIFNSIGQKVYDLNNKRFNYKNDEFYTSKIHLNRGIYVVRFADDANFKIKTFTIIVNGQ